jgi:hypothetical protein
MATAREIVRACLTFGLNRLSPGEAEDADTFGTCLNALNFIADEWNGKKAFLFREILTSGTVTAATGTLGTTWATLSPGDQILGASFSDGTQDIPITRIDFAQYHDIAIKSTPGDPYLFAHDGLATVYFYPVPTSRAVKLRTRQVVSEFADLDTVYSMPAGYKSALAAELAKKLAPTMNPGALPIATMEAKAARTRISAQTVLPALLDSGFYKSNIFSD